MDAFINFKWSSGMGAWSWVNIDPGNGLLPDGTKALPEQSLTYPQMTFVASTLQ